MKVLLITESGVLRRSIAQALVEHGHDVRALVRPDTAAPVH